MFSQTMEGTWKYEVLNTISGDYYGDLIIKKTKDSYEGNILSRGKFYDVKFNYIDNDSISFLSGVEGFIATIKGKVKGEKLECKVTVLGDPNIYDFNAKKKPQEQILKIVDSLTNEAIPYANIRLTNEGTISNEDGLCKVSEVDKIIISAIGYRTKTYQVKGIEEIEIVQLTPTDYILPLVEVKAKGFSVRKIVEAAINSIEANYIQKPYTANLFFRYSNANKFDSITYQFESLLKFYDSKGYQKRGWRNAVSSRYARLEQGRITVGKQNEIIELHNLDNLFVFWAHEPIVTRDKPLSKESIDAYDYKLVGVKEFMGEEVYELEFTCTNLAERYTGLPSLKSFTGKIYINKKDYAVLRYEQNYIMDYEFINKRTKKGWNGSERRINRNNRVEVFTKNDEEYYIVEYAKIKSNSEIQFISKNGEKETRAGTSIEEYQYFDIIVENIEPLNKNLFELDIKANYNPEYWEKFNIIIK